MPRRWLTRGSGPTAMIGRVLCRPLPSETSLGRAARKAFDAKAGPSGPCGGPAGNVRSVKFSALARFITRDCGPPARPDRARRKSSCENRIVAELVVPPDPDDVVGHPLVGRKRAESARGRYRENVGYASQVNVEVFELGRPVWCEHGLHPAADRPAALGAVEACQYRRGERDAGSGRRNTEVRFNARPGAAARGEPHVITVDIAKPATDCRQVSDPRRVRCSRLTARAPGATL